MKRLHLPEFIEIFVPTRDRAGKALSAVKQRRWRSRVGHFLLRDLGVRGFQESVRAGVWQKRQRHRRRFDVRTGETTAIHETVYVLRSSCSREQLLDFTRRGERLLIEMGKALRQEAVAYETRDGLVVLVLD